MSSATTAEFKEFTLTLESEVAAGALFAVGLRARGLGELLKMQKI